MRKLLLIIGLCAPITMFGQGNLNQAPATQIQPVQPSNVGKNQFASGSLIASPSTTSLNSIGSNAYHTCKSHELNEAHFSAQGILNEYNQSYYDGVAAVNPVAIDKTPGINTISVIFHVVHNPNNPAENVSNALIMQVFNDLTEDFQLLNADAAGVRPMFTPADANINFCLATQTPTGTPLAELGVIRVSTTEDWYNSDGGEENKMKAAATGGSQIWDRNRYLNIWICDISNGAGSGTAGYAYRPTTTYLPSASIDGIVLDYNLGMNNENVLTHEVGHYLGLDHTWGGSGGCGNDDGFADTPITDGPSFNYPGSCSGNQQTCAGTETQYENYMDYANCTAMFSQNQADYMLTILQGIRSSLLISTGCDPTNTPPNSAFSSIPAGPSPVVIAEGASVSFFDQSTNVPTGWNWVISGTPGVDYNYIGGTNASSANPQVTFYNVGLYDVTLTASNAFGADPTPASEPGYVQVVAPASGTACDTLRNWDPAYAAANGYYYYNAASGYSPGHGEFCGGANTCYGLQYAELFNYVGIAEVRRVALPFFIVDDQSGTGTMTVHIYENNGGVPGNILASETIDMADINEGFWNEFDFTTPASVSGAFWAGFELDYSGSDTILVGMTDTRPGGNDSYYIDVNGIGWVDGAVDVGITGSIALDVMLSNGPAPVADFTATNNLACVGGSIDVNGASSQNTTNYYWYLTDDPYTTTLAQNSNPSNTYTFPTAGDYAIYLLADGSCMTDAVYLPVTVEPAIAATVTPTATTCGNNNGSITITGATGGSGTYYYSLDGQNYYTSNTFNNLPSGTYTVYVATIGDNCETVYSNITVGSSSAFTATVTPNVSVCPGGSATIEAFGGVNYQWFDGATLIASTASTLVTPATQTQYTCVVTNGSGCQSSVQTTVTVFANPTPPTITPSGPTTFCVGSDVDLSSSYPTGNVWSTTESGSTITVSTSQSVTVTHTDANGCSSTSSPISITAVPLPTISVGTVNDPSTCATTTGSIEVTGSGTGTVSWTGTATGNATSVTLPFTIPNLAAGSYNITFTDGTGCSSNVLNQSLTDPTPPAAPTITPSGPTTFCAGGSVTLTSSYASGNTWSTAATTQNIVVSSSGTYSVTYTDGFGCSASSTPLVITVNNNPAVPTISAGGPTTFCDGGSVNLTSSQGSGNLWSTTATTPSINVTTSGSYTVTFTNANGCSSTSIPTVVTVNPTPTAPTISAGGATTFCDGGSVTLTSSQGSGNLWSTNETSASINVNTSGSYTVTYTDGNGCSNTSLATTVTVNALPSVNAGLDQTVCSGSSVTLSGSGASTYIWDNSVTNNVAFNPTATLTYTVTGTDANGCENTDQVTVTVNALPSVSMGSLSNTCENYAPFTLSGGTPAGGTYSGTGVTSGQFDPSVGAGTYTITYSFTDGNGCTNTADTPITVDACLAIDEFDATDVNVYPNPFTSQLTIEKDGKYSYEIIDATGRVVLQGNESNDSTIDVSILENGYYTLKVSDDVKVVGVRLTKVD